MTSNSFDPLHNRDQIAALIAEVSGEALPIVIEKLERERLHPGRTVADDFAARAAGKRYIWGKHMEGFYASTNAFLYELAVWNRNRLKGRLRRWIVKHLARQGKSLDVLSVGDGLGFDCLCMAAQGHRVTHFELPGPSERFARSLFNRTGASISALTDLTQIKRGGYDVVTCFDVLEHVPQPPDTIKELASYLRPGGLLYVSAPFYMTLPWYPTHLRSNRRFAGNLGIYRDAGLRLVDGNFTWFPIVLQKEGGSPLPRARSCTLIHLSGLVQAMGRLAAWPFLPVHLLRRMNNREFPVPRSPRT